MHIVVSEASQSQQDQANSSITPKQNQSRPLTIKHLSIFLALTLAGAEIASRAYESIYLRADSHDLRHNVVFLPQKNIWKYKQNTKIVSREKTGNITYTINKHGFRAIRKARPIDRARKILFIGDSVSFGLCSNTSIPEELQKQIGKEFIVESIALPGLNPKDYYHHFKESRQQRHYSKIIIMTYMNDLTDPSIMDIYNGSKTKSDQAGFFNKVAKIPEIILSFSSLRRTAEQAFRGFHYRHLRPLERSSDQWMYRKSKQPLAALEAVNSTQAKDNLKHLDKLSIESVLSTNDLYIVYSPHESALWTKEYEAIGNHLLGAVTPRKPKTLNLEPTLRSLTNTMKKEFYCDGIHFTDTGNKEIANILAEQIFPGALNKQS